MFIHLKDRKYYEDLYDRFTIEHARWGEKHYDKFHKEIEGKLPKDDKIDRPGNALVLNMFYMQAVGLDLIERDDNRERKITGWMDRDSEKDAQITNARLASEPICQHCKKTGLRIIDKHLSRRGDNYEYDDPEEVLFMLKCTHCQKNSAYWEDGSEWERIHTYCPKCKSVMTDKALILRKK